MTNKTKPAFKGLSWYREQYFSFFIPIDWQKTNWQDDRQGIIFSPVLEDNHTLFAVEVNDLGTTVTSDDLPHLSKGFLDGIKGLPDRKIESKKEAVTGKMLQLEAKYTFLENEQTRKRWVRVLYHETRQVTITAQGATIEAFDYWLPMFYEAMMTINVHNIMPDTPPA
jgi:hypothetical protein